MLWKDFKTFTTGITARMAASEGVARAAGRPFRYLPSVNLRKEDEAKKIALEDGIDSGFFAVFDAWSHAALTSCGAIERLRCWSSNCSGASAFIFTLAYHPLFGFMHLRLQSWFPFLIHITLNGREWRGRWTPLVCAMSGGKTVLSRWRMWQGLRRFSTATANRLASGV